MNTKLTQQSNSISDLNNERIGVLVALHQFDSYKFKAKNYKSIVKKYLLWLCKVNLPITKFSRDAYLKILAEEKELKSLHSYKTPINKLLLVAEECNFLGCLVANDTAQKTIIENQLAMYFEAFLQMDKGKPKSERTKGNYRQSFKRFAQFCEATNINQFTYLSVRKYADQLHEMLSKGQTTNFTYNTYLAPLRQFAKYLLWDSDTIFDGFEIDQRRKVENDLKKITQIANLTVEKDTYHKDSLTHQEVLNVLANAKDSRLQLMIALMYFAGLRTIEVLRLAHSSFNWKAKVLTVIGKGNKKAEIPLNHCIDALHGYYKNYLANNKTSDLDRLLFPTINHTATIRKQVNDLLVKVNLKHKKKRVSCHSFRHSLVQNLLIEGVPVEVVQSLARHTNISTTEVYFKKLQKDNQLNIPENLLTV